jgi:hypothetical protein
MGYREQITFHDSYPNVLGETTIGNAACPPLTLRTVNDNPATVEFEPLQTEKFDVAFDVLLVALGQYTGLPRKFEVLGIIGDEIIWGAGGEPGDLRAIRTFRLTDDIPSGDYEVKVDVDAETAAQILNLEREHKDDAQYAYEQTIEHLAAGVKSQLGKSFTGADEAAARRAALTALAGVVGEQFVPALPMVPANWSTLARQHCAALADQTKERDRKDGTHHLAWTARLGAPGVLRLVPIVPGPRHAPSELIKLDELPVATPDWTAEPASSCPFTIGQLVEVTADLELVGGKTIQKGWTGRFGAHDKAMTKFEFSLRAPGEEEKLERAYTVPAAQLGRLRAVDRPAATAPVSSSNPFQINDKVKVTHAISTSDGEIPAEAIGHLVDSYSTPTHVGLFEFPAVLRKDGRIMISAMIDRTDLQFLQRYDGELPPYAKTQPKAPDDTGSDDTGTDGGGDGADSDIGDNTGSMDFSGFVDGLEQMVSESQQNEGQTVGTGEASANLDPSANNQAQGAWQPSLHDSDTDDDTDDSVGFGDLSGLGSELEQLAGESSQDEDQPVDNGGISAELSHFADEVVQGVRRRLQDAGKTVDEFTAAAGKTVEELAAAIEEAIRKVRDKLS